MQIENIYIREKYRRWIIMIFLFYILIKFSLYFITIIRLLTIDFYFYTLSILILLATVLLLSKSSLIANCFPLSYKTHFTRDNCFSIGLISGNVGNSTNSLVSLKSYPVRVRNSELCRIWRSIVLHEYTISFWL